jgi:hypothetical protein
MIDGKPALSTFDDKTFDMERKHPTRIKVWVDHDRDLAVGELHRLWPQDGWWRAAFVLDNGITEELPVGQHVSVGLREFKSGALALTEVSLVRHGAVRGAEIIERLDLGPIIKATPPLTTPTPAAKPKPVEERRPAPQQVVYRQPTPNARHRAEGAELRRRLDWLEKHTGRPPDVEAVIVGMQREINGPTPNELLAQVQREKLRAA